MEMNKIYPIKNCLLISDFRQRVGILNLWFNEMIISCPFIPTIYMRIDATDLGKHVIDKSCLLRPMHA